MRRSYLAVVPALALMTAVITGCGGKPMTKPDIEKNLIGKWKLDKEQMIASKKAEIEKKAEKEKKAGNSLDNNSAAMAAMIDEVAQVEMTFEFKNNGKVSTTQRVAGQDQTQETDWKITRVDNGQATVEFGWATGAYVTFVDKDVIELTLLDEDGNSISPEEGPIPMIRMK